MRLLVVPSVPARDAWRLTEAGMTDVGGRRSSWTVPGRPVGTLVVTAVETTDDG
jgi:hypothetical protein